MNNFHIIILSISFVMQVMATEKSSNPLMLSKPNKNETISLNHMPKEILGRIMVNKKNSMQENIVMIVSITGTLNHFYKMLPYFGEQLKHHDDEEKANTMLKFLHVKMGIGRDYRAAMLLFYAGANFNVKLDNNHPNILWSSISDSGFASLTQRKLMLTFYLNQQVDPSATDTQNNCLLHSIASTVSRNDDVEIAQLLLKKISHMINTLNSETIQETPLDILLKEQKSTGSNLRRFGAQEKYRAINSLIAIYQKHGAKIAKELKQSTENR